MNRQVSQSTTSSPDVARPQSADKAQTSAQTESFSNTAYETFLLEKRLHWQFRIQICLILSFLAHIALLAYIHDKFILLKVDPTEKNELASLEDADLVPMPIREPNIVSGYDESRLDSPQVRDSIEQLTPTSPAEEQMFNDEKTQPSVDDLNASLDYEFQTPDSPELSDASNVTPIELSENKAPSEDVQPDISRTFNTQFNPSNVHKNIPIPKDDLLLKTVPHEQPESDFGAMGKQSIMADSTRVAVDVGEAESVNPAIDPTIFSISSNDALPEMNNQFPELTAIPVPEQIRPITPVRPNPVNHTKETEILAKSSSAIPKSQTGASVAAGVHQTPRPRYNSPTTYNNPASVDISQSIALDSPHNATSVSIPYDDNSGFGGLNGNEFKSLKTPPEMAVSIGAPSIIPLNHNNVVPSDAYKIRDPLLRPQMITQFGGDAEINETIEGGLKYLSQTQWPDGRWRFHQQPATIKTSQKLQQNGNLRCDTAATSLALLSMLGAGYTHKDGLYKEEIQKGLNYLIANQQTVPVRGINGKLGAIGALYNKETDTDVNSYSYAHAMATMVLCESYGMTRDPALLPAAQAAVRFIIATQNPKLGGWRYETEGLEGQTHNESDTSSSGWQIIALRSAMAAEVLERDEIIPTLNKAQEWLNRAQNPQNKRYIYNPDNGIDSKYADWKKTTTSMTAEGLFMQYCINPDIVDSQQIIPYLLQNLPGKQGDSEYSRDVYYWYYGTAVMFAQKGEAWNKWQSAIMPLLRDTQLPSTHPCGGSWDTEKPVIDKWSNIGGKHYITTMNLMILEIYIRHLSIYQ